MGGTVSTRWYFSDWMSDPGVRACSLAARGLWMDLLALAATNSGRDYGFVIVGGRKPTYAEIARLVQSSEDEVRGLISELDFNRVFSRDRRGVIYSRRMRRAEINRGNGRAGGNPNILKSQDNQKSHKALLPEPEPIPVRIPPVGPPKGARAPGKLRLPNDFTLSAEMASYASEHGLTGVESVFAAFCDHHRARGNVMVDWVAAWRTWVRNEVKFSQSRNGYRHDALPRPGSKEDMRERTQAVLRAFEAYDGTYDVRTGPRAGGSVPEILPLARGVAKP